MTKKEIKKFKRFLKEAEMWDKFKEEYDNNDLLALKPPLKEYLRNTPSEKALMSAFAFALTPTPFVWALLAAMWNTIIGYETK